MKKKSFTRYVILLLVSCALLWLYYHNDPIRQGVVKDSSFNRNLKPLIYTRHARCRMGCRHIDDAEVKEILQKGEINYSKSDLHSKPDPKYALEGITNDGQHVRIVFAPSKRGMAVITCIDMNEEWECNCN
ncbi:DUF4258 domain-containing protein [Agriterribacter sp.]|uniref:DUF4258 domain-containing protein n=1 Tax=Agriterribacter sp. TaxID=2821509 RepID=UPI002B7004F3|nr:DUF4258 domain-containing protein [Agriterribacter sp.]HRP54392.1 DUF4258 domain-containing protein [Agriterribacter sp.]